MSKGGSALGPIHKMAQRIQTEEFRRKLDAITAELGKLGSGRKGEELLSSKEVAPIVGVRLFKHGSVPTPSPPPSPTLQAS